MKKTNIISLIFAGFLLAGYTPVAQADFAGVVNFLEKAPWVSTKNALIYAGGNFGFYALLIRIVKKDEKVRTACMGAFVTALNSGVSYAVPSRFKALAHLTQPILGVCCFGGPVMGIVFAIPAAAALSALYLFGDKV